MLTSGFVMQFSLVRVTGLETIKTFIVSFRKSRKTALQRRFRLVTEDGFFVTFRKFSKQQCTNNVQKSITYALPSAFFYCIAENMRQRKFVIYHKIYVIISATLPNQKYIGIISKSRCNSVNPEIHQITFYAENRTRSPLFFSIRQL